MNDIVINKFHNTLVDYERNSSKFIASELFFIVFCNFVSSITLANCEEYVKKQIHSLQDDNLQLPLCAYYNDKCCAFLFSAKISEPHIFNGNQQQILSYFNSRATLEIKKYVETKIIELSSHTKILSYFQNIIYSHSREGSVGTFCKYDASSKDFTLMNEVPNLKDCERYKNFIFS